MPTHKTDSDGAIKKIKGQSKKYNIKKQEQDESSILLKNQKYELNKFYKKNKKKDTDLDDLIKELNEENEKNKLLEQQNKLLEQQNEQKKVIEQQNGQNKLLEQQNDELNKLLEQKKQEEDMLWDIINKLDRNGNEITKNINSRPSINFTTFAPRRDPFDDIEKITPSPSKLPAPITKSRKPQGLAAGEQAGIEIMKNDLKISKNYIENLKKELDNTELLSQRYLRVKDKIIQEEVKVLELEKKYANVKKI